MEKKLSTNYINSKMSSLTGKQLNFRYFVNQINYFDIPDFSNDKTFLVMPNANQEGPYVSPFTTDLNRSQTDSNFLIRTLTGKYTRIDTENSQEPITKTNFEKKFPDNLYNFLISLCKCLELWDECSSACLVECRIILSFNNLKAGSEESNKEMTSILEFIDLILKYDFNSDDDYELLSHYMCKIKDYATGKPHEPEIKKDSIHRYTTLLKDFIWIKMPNTDSADEIPIARNALLNFAVCFNRVITSSFLPLLKKGTYTIEIVGNGKDEKHAEIRLMRYLIKTYRNEKNKIEDLFIATSKRPCFYCHQILKMYPESELNISFNIINSSHKKFNNYKKYWPNFLLGHPKFEDSFDTFARNFHEKELTTDLNVSTFFKFNEVVVKGESEERESRLREEIRELKEEIRELKEENRELKEEIRELKLTVQALIENAKKK